MSLIPCCKCGKGIKKQGYRTDGVVCNECASKPKLITIELDSFKDEPVVHFRGKRIKNIQDINFQWFTDTDEPGDKKIGITYFDLEEHVVKGIKEIKM
ncbi:hypothetical protein [uncultured Metabacillus sp.]|uniref:hypothetical protein n=1 Tax=uncultured Metabacillus sp. TaxID=2860135 RepID=UPI00262C68CB|nr:hypothetical protein [uncultured Metabacillus sp.]